MSSVVIGAMGRLTAEKGFDIFLNALKILKDNNIDFVAKLGGDGVEFEKLKQLSFELGIQDNINFLGWIDNKKDFFDSIDIFVLSSRFESFGIVLLDAMKYKKPIISTKCDGPLEIISNGKNGMLIEDFSAEKMAEALMSLIANDKLKHELAEQAFKDLAENYSQAAMSASIDYAIEKIIPKGNKNLNILNITFNNARGGVEQSFIDYTDILQQNGHKVHTLVCHDAGFLPELKKVNDNINLSRFLRAKYFGFLLSWQIKKIIKKANIQLVILHAERNIKHIKSASNVPLVAVNHGGKIKNIVMADHIFVVNSKIADKLAALGYRRENISVIKNMIKI